MNPLQILLVDDHNILRQGLKQILQDDFENVVFGEAENAADAMMHLRNQHWDVLILDINLPGRNGFDVLAGVRRDIPGLPVLVLSSTPEDQLGLRALRAGATGFLNKQTAPEQLVAAVRQLLAGERFVSKSLAQKLLTEIGLGASTLPRHECLSTREHQVFLLCARGNSVKAIAEELALSAKTISTFRARIFEKLGLTNDVELAHYAREHQLLSD